MEASESQRGFPFLVASRRRFRPDDPFFAAGNIERELLAKQAKVARGFPMFECLVEGCELKLKSYKSRQQHLIDKHKFPTSFEFYKKARPSKHHRQKNQGKQSGRRRESKTESDMDVDGKKTSKHPEEVGDKFKNPNEMGMEVEGELNELVSAVSKLSTSDSSTPSSVSFGHRHARGFTFLPRSLRQPNVKQPSRSDAK